MITTLETKTRVRVVDAIRGLCLLGILAANMLIFQYGMYGKEELEQFGTVSRIDHAAHIFLKIAVEGSFMPIFLFLFGYSLYKLRDSLQKKGLKPWRSLVRRFLMLTGLGLAHGMLLWEGDILLLYGLMGFILLLFVKRKVKTLMIWATILSVIMLGLSYGAVSESNSMFEPTVLKSYIEQSIPVYGQGSYSEIMDFRNNESPMNDDPILAAVLVMIAPLVLAPMFLFGIAAAKANWLHNPMMERRRYAIIAAIALPTGLVFKGVAIVLADWSWGGMFMQAGYTLLPFGYIFAAAYVFSRAGVNSRMASAFEAVGRMSLTNYLMQTVICTTIFYGYGLGWFGKLGVLYGIALTLFIFFLQAAASSVILRRVKYGPIEKLLRIWTYWSLKGTARNRKLSPTRVELDT